MKMSGHLEIEICGRSVLIDKDDALMFVGVTVFVGSNGYAKVWRRGRESYVHRIIAGAEAADEVDHINGNRLDNRRVNLRKCDHQQNTCNVKLRTDNQTGVTGVYWDKKRLQWSAQISAKNKTIPLGRFNSFDEAVAARRSAEKKYHGEFSGTEGARRDGGAA